MGAGCLMCWRVLVTAWALFSLEHSTPGTSSTNGKFQFSHNLSNLLSPHAAPPRFTQIVQMLYLMLYECWDPEGSWVWRMLL